VLRVPSLGKDQAIFLLQAVLYNHESEAVDARWLGLTTIREKIGKETLDLNDVMKRVGLTGPTPLVNNKEVKRARVLQSLVPAIVAETRGRVLHTRKAYVKAELMTRARTETRRLQKWAEESLAFIESRTASYRNRGAKVPRHIEERLHHEREHVGRVQRNHEEFLKSLQATGEPNVRLAAVFSGE
jgi:hypothetical protein